jgi:hypothetical protein
MDPKNRVVAVVFRPMLCSPSESDSGSLTVLFNDEDPPNAAVVLTEADSENQDVIIVQLRNPQYDVTQRRFTYDVEFIDEI